MKFFVAFYFKYVYPGLLHDCVNVILIVTTCELTPHPTPHLFPYAPIMIEHTQKYCAPALES